MDGPSHAGVITASPAATRAFFGLEETSDSNRWRLPVTPSICTPGGFMFGGCALGAAIAALEDVTGRPTIWASAQFISYARPPDVVELETVVAAAGRQITQARAVGSVMGREVLSVSAALGQRQLEPEGTWAVMPAVPSPAECEPRVLRLQTDRETVSDRIEIRLAHATAVAELPGRGMAGGRSALWAHIPADLDVSPSLLSILGDYVPFGIGQALGLQAGGNSLDNNLRVGRIVDSEWILMDIRVNQIVAGVGHGDVHLWSESGVLLASASQSTIVRMWREMASRTDVSPPPS